MDIFKVFRHLKHTSNIRFDLIDVWLNFKFSKKKKISYNNFSYFIVIQEILYVEVWNGQHLIKSTNLAQSKKY